MSITLLKKRGISDPATRAGWHDYTYKNQAGWAYPVYEPIMGVEIAKRWKSAQSGGMKYAWIPNKPASPTADWYILPETFSAIAHHDGVAYLANGEPALLAYHAAGIQNVIATTLSEVAVPKNMLIMLNDLGISRLLYPVDKDAAGEKSAISWRDALRESGIDFEAYTWGDDAPEKADANDIWMQVGFDTDEFATRLNNLSELNLPVPEAKTQFDDADFEHTPPRSD